jgi:pimeloyl-ACP methyl ester carboxylesterase
MNTYLLVHGMWHGAWCWNKVIFELQKAGQRVIAVDLPGHGADKTPISKISFQGYVDCICQTLDKQSEPVILLGHSMGGVVVTQASEFRPDKTKMLVYLAAFVPQNGDSIRTLAHLDPNPSLMLRQNLVISEDKSFTTIKEYAIREIFYHDCSAEDIDRARSLLCPEPTVSSIASVKTTVDNFGRIPKIYIRTLQDKAISPQYQEKMYSAMTFQKIIEMNTSHSPFFAAPDELVTHLLSL